MHDPMTVAWEIKSPIKRKSKFSPEGYRNSLITIWHVDPERDGTDDSCGWFKRSRHGDKEVLRKTERDFKSDWHVVFEGRELPSWFNADGSPQMSVQAITLAMFRWAAWNHFGQSWKKVDRFLKDNLLEIIWFAENRMDSLSQSINQRYGAEPADRRISNLAGIVYGCVLRWDQPWYRHPRWHVHHWKFQIHPLQTLRRFLFERCSICGKGYSWGYCPIGNWSGDKTWHQECDNKKESSR